MTRTHEAPQETVPVTRWVGWVVFAGLVMLVGGVLNLVQGLVALIDEGYYQPESDLLIGIDYQVWGWLMVVFGAIVAVAGHQVLSGRTWARWVAVLVLGFDALLNFAFAGGYPFWSILAIVLDVIVIYALTVHGREARIMRP